MESVYIICLQVIAVFISIYIAFAKKKSVYVTTFTFNFLNLLVYLLTGDITSVVTYILISVRSFVYIFKDKFKVNYLPWVFIVLHIILGVLTMSSYVQLLPILAPCLTCAYMWYSEDEQQLRLGNIGVAVTLGLYNGICGLYGLLISRVITIVANIVGYIKSKTIGV